MSNRACEILRTLVQIPSINPENGGDPSTLGEKKVAEWIANFLEDLGADVVLEDVLPQRPNVIARFRHDDASSRVLFAPHTDTVGIDGMTVDPFAAEIRDGRLYGRGACDTKGTIAAMLAAFEEIGPDRLRRLPAEISFVGLMGEETGQPGSQHFAQHHQDYDFAVVGEPTSREVVHTHKGCTWLQLQTFGRACHGSTPELGINAIAEMMPIFSALTHDFTSALRAPRWAHPVLGSPTLNIGRIRGGTRTNIVPEKCTIDLDLRETPALHAYGSERLLREWLASHGWEKTTTLTSTRPCPPLDISADHAYVQVFASLGCPLVGAPWLCDATWLWALGGIPSVAIGPGSIAQAHTADEFIDLHELSLGTALYRDFILALR